MVKDVADNVGNDGRLTKLALNDVSESGNWVTPVKLVCCKILILVTL